MSSTSAAKPTWAEHLGGISNTIQRAAKPPSNSLPIGARPRSSPTVTSYIEKTEIGMLCVVIGKAKARERDNWEENRWGYEIRLDKKSSSMTQGAGGHMVIVYNKYTREWRPFRNVVTVTTKGNVLGLSARNLVPIFPNTNAEFSPNDTHNVTYRLDNILEDTFGNPLSFLRRDNAFGLPDSVLEPILGRDGKPIMLDKSSLQDFQEYMEENYIVQNSSQDHMWLVNRGLQRLGLPTGTTHKNRIAAEERRDRGRNPSGGNEAGTNYGNSDWRTGNPARTVSADISGATAALQSMSVSEGQRFTTSAAPLAQASTNSHPRQDILNAQGAMSEGNAQQNGQSTPSVSSSGSERNSGHTGHHGGRGGRGGRGGGRGTDYGGQGRGSWRTRRR